MTPIHVACTKGYLDVVKALVDEHVDVNLQMANVSTGAIEGSEWGGRVCDRQSG